MNLHRTRFGVMQEVVSFVGYCVRRERHGEKKKEMDR